MDSVDEIDENAAESNDAFTAYLAEGEGKSKEDRPIVFCPELGLSIEQIREGFTLDSLWQVLPPEPAKKSHFDWRNN